MTSNINTYYKQLGLTLPQCIKELPKDQIEKISRVLGELSELQQKGYKSLEQIFGEIATGKIKVQDGSIKFMSPDGKHTGLTRFVKQSDGSVCRISKIDNNPITVISDGKTDYKVMSTVGDLDLYRDKVPMYKTITTSDGSVIRYGDRKLPKDLARRMVCADYAFMTNNITPWHHKVPTLKNAVEEIRKVDKQ